MQIDRVVKDGVEYAVVTFPLANVEGPSSSGQNIIVAKCNAPMSVPGSLVKVSGFTAYRPPKTEAEHAACIAQKSSDKGRAAEDRKTERRLAAQAKRAGTAVGTVTPGVTADAPAA